MPKWRESRISFKNVYVSRRPEPAAKSLRQNQLKKNEHLTAVGYDVSNHPGYHHLSDDDDEVLLPPIALDEEDLNMSVFDLTIDSVDVTLSLWRWLDGKGLVEDAVIRGVRGVLGSHLLKIPVIPSPLTYGQIGGMFFGIPTTHLIQLYSDITLFLETLSWSLFNSKTCW